MLGAGSDAVLAGATVAVFGLGGVGSFAAEALARAGVGHLILVDADAVEESNLNRQLYALHSTLGRKKAEVAAERARDINPLVQAEAFALFYPPDADGKTPVDLSRCSFIADCIDSVPSKVNLIANAQAAGVPLLSCMGTGNKTDPLAFRFADIYSTSVCPLARAVRRELRKRGITAQRVLFSTEPPVPDGGPGNVLPGVRRAVGSVPFVPPVAGLLMAGEIIRGLLVAS